MKKAFFLLIAFSPLFAVSQSKLYFSYDAAGNQILRNTICVNCGGIKKPALEITGIKNNSLKTSL